jgi:hypothetical protein
MPTPVEIQPVTPIALDISDLTEGSLCGEGVLDKLLKTMKAHLDDAYQADRITKQDYGSLFMQGYVQTLQLAITLTMAKETQGFEILKLQKEIAGQDIQNQVYQQKLATELANIDGSAVLPNSALGYQHALLKAQTDGFKRNGEQQLAKLMIDTWLTRANNETASVSPDNLLQDINIGAAVRAAYEGVGVTPESVPI